MDGTVTERLFQSDLSFLFATPSVWSAAAAVLLLVVPLSIGLSGYCLWRVGSREGVWLMAGVLAYLGWMFWPLPMDPDLARAGKMVSVLGWVWLLDGWRRRLRWDDMLLLVANGIVLISLISLAVLVGIGWRLA